jgi:hypothetical protein
VTSVRDSVGETLGDVAGRAGQLTADAGRTAQEQMRNAQDGIGQGMDAVRGQAMTAGTQARDLFDRTLQQNPLALGALAAAAGAAAGIVIQETRKEQELYAQPREQLMQTAAARVSDVLDQASDRAQEMADQMTSSDGPGASSAEQSARSSAEEGATSSASR